MIRIETSSKRLPEKTYALQIILGDLLGLEFEVYPTASSGFRLSRGDQKEIVLSDYFFNISDSDWLEPASLPSLPLAYLNIQEAELNIGLTEARLPILYGQNDDEEWLKVDENKIALGLDIFGSAFFLLTDYESLTSKEFDIHGRFLGKQSVAAQAGFIHRPLVQEYAEFLWSLLHRLWPNLKRTSFNFSILPSHDVDNPFQYLLTPTKKLIAPLASDILKRRSLATAFSRMKTIRRVKRGLQGDPFDTFDWLMQISEEYKLVSTFNFMAAEPSSYDFGYSPFDASIQRLMKNIDQRGHRIGFHPGYKSSENESIWFSEYEALVKASPQPIKAGRQHFLRSKPPKTWRNWEKIGADYEGSLAYPDLAGFRGGMVRAFQAFDLKERNSLNLRIQPLMLMDSTLLGYMKLEDSSAYEYAQRITSICRKYEGDLTILWHNSDAVQNNERQLYRSIIKYACEG